MLLVIAAQFRFADFGFTHLSVDLAEEGFAHTIDILADADDGHRFLHDFAEEVLVDLKGVVEAVGLGGEEIILDNDLGGEELLSVLHRIGRHAHLTGDICSGVDFLFGDFHSNLHDNFSFYIFLLWCYQFSSISLVPILMNESEHHTYRGV